MLHHLFLLFLEFIQFTFNEFELVHAYDWVIAFALATVLTMNKGLNDIIFSGLVKDFVGEDCHLCIVLLCLSSQFFITFDLPTHLFNLLHVLNVILG